MTLLIWRSLEFKSMARIDNIYEPSALGKCIGYQNFIDTFGNVVHKDSPGQNFGFDARILAMKCIDMDRVEIAQGGSNDKTMDVVLGLADFDDVRQVFSRKYLLPVELKLNCVAFNLQSKDLSGKDTHTRSYNLGIGFCATSVFLFTKNVVSHAQNSIHRWKLGSNSKRTKEWKVMTPQVFNSFIKFKTDFPYIPQTDMGIVEQQITTFLASQDIDGCAAYIQDTFRKRMEAYSKVHNTFEIKYVAEKLKDIMRTAIDGSTLRDFEKEYLNLAAETIYGLANY